MRTHDFWGTLATMIYVTILATHIVLGLASFIIAPMYIYSAIKGRSNMQTLKKGMSLSIIGTVLLGGVLILAGAPLGRSCIALTLYIAVTVGLLTYGNVKSRHTTVKI